MFLTEYHDTPLAPRGALHTLVWTPAWPLALRSGTFQLLVCKTDAQQAEARSNCHRNIFGETLTSVFKIALIIRDVSVSA